MAGLKVFVSSTCYDLAEERAQVRNMLVNLGHDPVLSDYNDVYYGSNDHTHVSCIKQVANADMVVLLIGSRYGGVAIDDALNEINIEIIQDKLNNKINLKDLINEMQERSKKSLEEHTLDSKIKKIVYGFSITHFEILRAIQEDIPIYAFVKDKVWNFNELYIYNKDNIENIKIPAIEKHQSKYLFEFIEILKNRKVGNFVFSYTNYLDIEKTLKKQLAEKLRSLMDEQKNLKKFSEFQQAQIDQLTLKFDDLKEAILSTLPKGNEKEVAKGVIQFRGFISSLLYMFNKLDLKYKELLSQNFSSFESFVEEKMKLEFVEYSFNLHSNFKSFLTYKYFGGIDKLDKIILKNDKSFFMINKNLFDVMIKSWGDFNILENSVKETIIEAIIDNGASDVHGIKFYNHSLDVFVENQKNEIVKDLLDDSENPFLAR